LLIRCLSSQSLLFNFAAAARLDLDIAFDKLAFAFGGREDTLGRFIAELAARRVLL